MRRKGLSGGPCARRLGRLTANVGRPGEPEEYSGFVVVRLSPSVAAADGDDLMEVAKRLQLEGLGSILSHYGLSSTRPVIRSLPPDEIVALEREAAKTDLPPLRSLVAYWRVDARHRQAQIEEILKRLNELAEVDLAYRELAVSEPIVNAADDPYAPSQDYLNAAPTGIDARWAWTQPNGEGAGVALIDLEQGWFPNHEDLAAKSPTLIHGDNRDGVGSYKGDHGTAVLGEIVAEDNTVGVVGIAPAVTSVRMVSHYDASSGTDLHVADAIVAAIPVLNPGDLLLLEVQRAYRPTEVDDADFDAVRLAVAHGIIVVEAAGNGGADLDNYTDSLGDKILNRADAAFRESGAIVVGASESALPHNRWAWSNFGSRIDCYGWGENVVTCGYGDLDAGTGDNSTYTNTFDGTSSASPIITGAAILLQGMYEAAAGTRLSPTQMRALLSNPATGTDQGPGTAGDIGVMPDLRAIAEDTLDLVPDLCVRDNVGDTGVVPSVGSISASPDVIVLPTPVANPDASFGQGSGTENSTTLGYEVEAGQSNWIYVRMKNRGWSDANGVTATVYWSEVSTLLTPDMWNLIGTTLPVNVPQGDTLVVAGPLEWASGDIPGKGHYCYVVLLDHPQDPAPPLPPGPPHFNWDEFRSFVRNHNNVTWRNFNVVDDIPDSTGDPAVLPFLIAGAPDRARVFDLEVIQRLPKEAEVWLEVPLVLSSEIVQKRVWEVNLDRRRQVARIRLPSQVRIPVCQVQLGAGGKHQAQFIVRGARGMERGGHGIIIRQLFEDDEVGRITWQFHRRREGGEKST